MSLGVCTGVAHAGESVYSLIDQPLAPGAQQCPNTKHLGGPFADRNVRAYGRVNSGHAVTFTLDSVGPWYYHNLDTAGPVTSFFRAHDYIDAPRPFPATSSLRLQPEPYGLERKPEPDHRFRRPRGSNRQTHVSISLMSR